MPIRRISPPSPPLPTPESLPDASAISPTTDPVGAPTLQEPVAGSHSLQSQSRQRGHARRNEDGKFEPAGDYGVGFARPPEATRFKRGNPGGPGRPKSSLSHDTLMRKELKQKRPVRIDGRTQNLTTRELLLKTMIKDALAGDKLARRIVFSELSRLFPAEVEASNTPTMAQLNESDALSLAEFKAMLLGELTASHSANGSFADDEAGESA